MDQYFLSNEWVEFFFCVTPASKSVKNIQVPPPPPEVAKPKFSHFHILKLLFPSIFCWYFRYFVSETHIFRSQNTSAYIHNQCSFLLYKRQYTDKTLTLGKSMYLWVSRASEIRKFLHFHILKMLFLSIFCWCFRYFVGTNDMLVGLRVPTNFQMYRQNSKRALWGGGGSCPPAPPPPPSGYANVPYAAWRSAACITMYCTMQM